MEEQNTNTTPNPNPTPNPAPKKSAAKIIIPIVIVAFAVILLLVVLTTAGIVFGVVFTLNKKSSTANNAPAPQIMTESTTDATPVIDESEKETSKPSENNDMDPGLFPEKETGNEDAGESENPQEKEAKPELVAADAYKAYYDYLVANPSLNYLDYVGEQCICISFYDCYGDSYPEMIYAETIEEDYGDYTFPYTYLKAATYNGKKVVELTGNEVMCHVPHAGAPEYKLFTVGESKRIYGIEYGATEAMEYFNLFRYEKGDDGLLHPESKLSFEGSMIYDSNDSPTEEFEYEYKKGDEKVSKETFDKNMNKTLHDINIVNRTSEFDGYFEEQINFSQNVVSETPTMTYDEALEYLMGKMSE